jgi:hypothetical protein
MVDQQVELGIWEEQINAKSQLSKLPSLTLLLQLV